MQFVQKNWDCHKAAPDEYNLIIFYLITLFKSVW